MIRNFIMELSGQYEFIPDESDSYDNFLRVLGQGEVVRLAAKQIKITLEIVLSDTHYTVFQKSQVGHTRRTIRVNKSSKEWFTEQSEDFTISRRIQCQAEPNSIMIFTEMDDVKMRTKTTKEEENKIRLETTILKSGQEPTTINRKFARTGDVSPEILSAHTAAVSNNITSEIIRVTPSSLRKKKS